MRSFRSTLIFAVIVAGLVGYAVFEMKRGDEKQGLEGKQDRIFHWEEKEVKELVISRPEGKLQLVRENDTFSLKAPVDDRTEGFAATSFLSSILSQSAKVSEEKNNQWKEYGLDSTPLSLEITSIKGEKKSYQFGQEKAFDGSYFLRDGDRLLVGTSDWDRLLNKSVSELRDKQLYRGSGSVDKLNVISSSGGVQLRLVKIDGKWVDERDKSILLNQEEVNKYISDITDLRASDFIAEDTNETLLEKYHLRQPALQIELWLEKTKEKNDASSSGNSSSSSPPDWWLKLGKEGKINTDKRLSKIDHHSNVTENDAYAYSSTRKTIYKLSSDSFLALAKNFDFFRDKKVPFRFQSELAKDLTLKTRLADIHLVKKDNQWQSLNSVLGKEVDQTEVQNLLTHLGQMETRYYLGKKKGKGLDQNSNGLHLKDGDGKILFEMNWGESFKAQQELKANEGLSSLTGKGSASPGVDEDLYYVKTNLTPELLGVSVSKINEWARQSLLKDIKKVENPSSTPTAASPSSSSMSEQKDKTKNNSKKE